MTDSDVNEAEEPGTYTIILKKKGESKAHADISGLSEMDQIRRLLAGDLAQIVKADLAELEKRVNDIVASARTEQAEVRRMVEALREKLRSGVEDSSVIKESVVEHGQMLRIFSDAVRDIEKILFGRTEEMSNVLTAIRTEHNLLTSYVYTDLQVRLTQLEAQKMSGESLSTAFFDLAQRLRKTGRPGPAWSPSSPPGAGSVAPGPLPPVPGGEPGKG